MNGATVTFTATAGAGINILGAGAAGRTWFGRDLRREPPTRVGGQVGTAVGRLTVTFSTGPARRSIVTKSDGVTTVTAGDGRSGPTRSPSAMRARRTPPGVSLTDTLAGRLHPRHGHPSQGTCTGARASPARWARSPRGASATVTVTYTVPSSTTGSPQATRRPSSSTTTDPNTAQQHGDRLEHRHDQRRPLGHQDRRRDERDRRRRGHPDVHDHRQQRGPVGRAGGVSLTDTWPAGFTRGTVTPSQGTCTGSPSFTCALGTIAAGGDATVTVDLHRAARHDRAARQHGVASSSAATDPDGAQQQRQPTSNTVTTRRPLGHQDRRRDDRHRGRRRHAGPTRSPSATPARRTRRRSALTDTWPAGFTRGTVTPSQGTCTGSPSFTCALGTIAAAARRTVTVNYTVPARTTGQPDQHGHGQLSTTTDPTAAQQQRLRHEHRHDQRRPADHQEPRPGDGDRR